MCDVIKYSPLPVCRRWQPGASSRVFQHRLHALVLGKGEDVGVLDVPGVVAHDADAAPALQVLVEGVVVALVLAAGGGGQPEDKGLFVGYLSANGKFIQKLFSSENRGFLLVV